ncbi:hypothetical protein [Urbifossiella limnaea]|uniref:hypothetical protein n=1 Tax=Urbifossiella limnaea TaxID=2528023 RepID=UPI0011A398FD|nr:hypothetical protein [Urbifossiella limnaea]
MTVRSPWSLVRLANLTSAANVGLQVGYNWYRHGKHEFGPDDLGLVVYRLEVPGAREPGPDSEPGPDGSTTLQIVGICLVDYLREKELLVDAEAERLNDAFNNRG